MAKVSNGWQEALGSFKQRLEDGGAASSAISCGRAMQWQVAMHLALQMLEATELSSSSVVANAAISACEKASRWPMALRALQEVRWTTLRLNVISYNSVIGWEKGWQRSLSFFEELSRWQIDPDIISYNSLITSCEKSRSQWERAFHLWDEIRLVNLRANIISSNGLLSCFEKCSQWSWATEVLGRSQSASLQPNVISCNACLSSLEKGSEWPLAASLLDHWTSDLTADVVSYSALISCYGQGKQWQLALELVATEMADVRIAPNVISYNAAITSCERGFQWQMALELLQKMSKLQVLPNVISYGAAVRSVESGSSCCACCRTCLLPSFLPTSSAATLL